ncbi:MAG: hypothetical protein NT069_11475 [Planctomycetota bacterium]|nr:hypothetical protein [Planctomycetota bacterium]
MLRRAFCIVIAAGFCAVAGCGGVKPVTGGTKGTLRIGGELLSEIQVTVHRVEGTALQTVGFGVTTHDGSFELVTNGAQGPLRLVPGDYRFTLESAGAPFQVSQEFGRPETTPVKSTWGAGDVTLNLDVPVTAIAR